MAFTTTEWKAIKWYADGHGYTIRDMMKGPIVVFRDNNDDTVDVNIYDIKKSYAGRARGAKNRKKVES